jgi:hypothetical protein
MRNLASDLNGWTTDELLVEVLRRSAADRPALQLLQIKMIRALLAEGDLRSSARALTART